MNKDQVLALLRQLLTLASGFAMAKWGLDGAAMEAVGAGIVAVVSIGFDIRNNSTAQTLAAAKKIEQKV